MKTTRTDGTNGVFTINHVKYLIFDDEVMENRRRIETLDGRLVVGSIVVEDGGSSFRAYVENNPRYIFSMHFRENFNNMEKRMFRLAVKLLVEHRLHNLVLES